MNGKPNPNKKKKRKGKENKELLQKYKFSKFHPINCNTGIN